MHDDDDLVKQMWRLVAASGTHVIHLFVLAFFKNEHREKVSGIQAAFLHEEESGSEAAICSPVTPRRAAVADGKADRRSESRRRR